MAERKPTPPQVRVLEAARDGALLRSDGWGYRPVRTDGHPVRQAVVKACLDAGWLRIHKARGAVSAAYLLTDHGTALMEVRRG